MSGRGQPMSIPALKEIQSAHGLCDVHLVDLADHAFTLAHTDEERATGRPLEECALHTWLHEQGGPPEEPGVYVVTPHEVDAYSEPYPVAQWDFMPLGLASVLVAEHPDRPNTDNNPEGR